MTIQLDMLFIRIAIIFICLHVVAFSVIAQLSENCENSGRSGRCLLIDQCPAAIELLKERKQPKLCGFDKRNPIVCCENVTDVAQKFGEPGDTARQKCYYYITNTRPTTTTTTTTTPSPSDLHDYDTKLEDIISDGIDAQPLEFPHMALLGYGPKNAIQWQCGGSLISEKFVLTAAHCIYSKLGKISFVRLGAHQITIYSKRGKQFEVKNTYQHPDYNPLQKYHDIALVEIDGEVVFVRKGIIPACLQFDEDIPDVFTATGWGATAYGGGIHNTLQKVNLTLMPIEICQRIFRPGSGLEKGVVNDFLICAGSIEGRHGDTCPGDSGGPLQVKIDGTHMYSVLGITSIGKKCSLVPAVYTRVSYYISWIESVVWPLQA